MGALRWFWPNDSSSFVIFAHNSFKNDMLTLSVLLFVLIFIITVDNSISFTVNIRRVSKSTIISFPSSSPPRPTLGTQLNFKERSIEEKKVWEHQHVTINDNMRVYDKVENKDLPVNLVSKVRK